MGITALLYVENQAMKQLVPQKILPICQRTPVYKLHGRLGSRLYQWVQRLLSFFGGEIPSTPTILATTSMKT